MSAYGPRGFGERGETPEEGLAPGLQALSCRSRGMHAYVNSEVCMYVCIHVYVFWYV